MIPILKEAGQENSNPVPGLAHESLNILMDYHWPGNVRELKNVIQFSVVRSRGKLIMPEDLPAEVTKRRSIKAGEEETLEKEKLAADNPANYNRSKLDIESVKAALKKAGGNKTKAAKILKVGRATLYRFLSQDGELKEYADSL